jgi:hypothetical protein
MTILLIGTFVFGGIHTALWLPRALAMQKEKKRRAKETPRLRDENPT